MQFHGSNTSLHPWALHLQVISIFCSYKFKAEVVLGRIEIPVPRKTHPRPVITYSLIPQIQHSPR